MDYEKKYKEALKKAEAFYFSATTEPITEREVLANIFPELKESEDERIRKEIISALKYANHKGVYDKHLAWLEKQGEQNPVEWSEEDERMRQYVVNDLRFVKEIADDPNYAVSVERVENEIDWMESLKERIGE